MSELQIHPIDPEREVGELAEIEGWAFGFPSADAAGWFDSAGLENIRVARASGRMLGGLILIPMGQWFGGKSVSMTGVAGVAVAPEDRGKGVALALMRSALREMRDRGVALSALYPATLSLYRLAGYECAGNRFKMSARPRELAVFDRSLTLRVATDADTPVTERMYRELATESAGMLDRGPYIWRRARTPRGATARGYVIEGDAGAEGYFYVSQKSHTVGEYDLVLSDAVVHTQRAARRLLSFLSDHRTLARSLLWYGGPADPLVAELPETAFEMTLAHQWMTRVVNVSRALESRGYSEHVSAVLELQVHDELLPENSGLWTLEIERGAVSVRAGGRGHLKVGSRGLAPLYTGFRTPHALKRAGLLDGDEASLGRAQSVFQGPAPAMAEMF
jgi:predicted acetyltransferase